MRYSVMCAVMSVVMLLAVCGGMAQDAEAWPWSQPSPLPPEAVEKIKGRAGWSSFGFPEKQFSGTIKGALYNRNEDWEVTSITIKILPKEETLKAELSQSCKATLHGCLVGDTSLCNEIGPTREGAFYCFEVYAPQGVFEFDWYITEVKGYN